METCLNRVYTSLLWWNFWDPQVSRTDLLSSLLGVDGTIPCGWKSDGLLNHTNRCFAVILSTDQDITTPFLMIHHVTDWTQTTECEYQQQVQKGPLQPHWLNLFRIFLTTHMAERCQGQITWLHTPFIDVSLTARWGESTWVLKDSKYYRSEYHGPVDWKGHRVPTQWKTLLWC